MALIRKAAVKAFLERPRRDFNAYREWSLRKLQDRVEHLPIIPPIWKALHKEQRVGFIAGVEAKKFCFWYDMGMGKTLLAIALARYFRRRQRAHRVIVLIPNKINKYEWASEIRKHSPKSTYTVLEGSSANKWKQLEASDSLFVIETYGGLVHLLCKTVRDEKKKKNKLEPDAKLIRRFLTEIEGIVMDESIHVVRKKGWGSLMHRLCKRIARVAEFAYALNGTPFGRDPTDMWGQFHIVDEGETLGKTLGLFRAAFMKETTNYWGGTTYSFDKKKEKLLNKIIGNRSIRYEADESTLPRLVPIVKAVDLPEDAEEYYEKARQQVIASKGNFREMKNAFLRMRQISSGFVGYHDDELGEKASYQFDENPKLDQTMSLVEECTHAHKMVIFHEFTFSGQMLSDTLKAMGIKHSRLYGGTKDHERQLAQFHDDVKTRVMLLQNASGGFGLDRLKVARYGAYYESPVGTVLRVQTGRRIRRQGSDHTRVFLYDVIVRDTVDQQILDAHEQGIDLFQAIMKGRIRPK